MNEDFNRRPITPSKAMTVNDFALWGLEDIAYVKRIQINDEFGWSIHGADGVNIGLSADRDQAFAAIRQYDLQPVSVH